MNSSPVMQQYLRESRTPYERLHETVRRTRANAAVFKNIFFSDPNRGLERMFRGHFTGLLEGVSERG